MRDLVEPDCLELADLGRDIDDTRIVSNDLEIGGCARDEGFVEPGEVFAHEPPRQKVWVAIVSPLSQCGIRIRRVDTALRRPLVRPLA